MSPARRVPKLVDPLRYPGQANDTARTARAWYFLLLTAFFPGTVQLVAGNRRLARLGLSAAALGWLLAITAIVLAFTARDVLLTALTSSIVLLVLTVLALIGSVVWALCFFDTLRLVRFVGLRPKVRGWVAGAAAVVLVMVGGGLAYGTSTLNSHRGLISGIFASGGASGPVEGRYNILLLGSDAGAGRTGIRPDSISVVSVDAESGQPIVFGIPRNMQNVPFAEGTPLASVYPDGYNCGDECLVNSIYLQGQEHADLFEGVEDPGAQAMIDAASGITGLDVQFYAMIDLDGFEELIDAVGGLTIVSGKRVPKTKDLSSTAGEPEDGWIEAGEQHMDGETALWFARSRRGSSDYERMARQRCVQEAMLKQLDPATLLLRFQGIARAAPDMVSTDIPEAQLSSFAELAQKAAGTSMIKASFVPPDVTPAHPDFAHVHQMVEEAIAESDAVEESDEALPGDDPDPSDASESEEPVQSGGAVNAVAEAAPEPEPEPSEEDDEAICYVP